MLLNKILHKNYILTPDMNNLDGTPVEDEHVDYCKMILTIEDRTVTISTVDVSTIRGIKYEFF